MSTVVARPLWALVAAIIAVLFGALTIVSGGSALFGSVEARTAIGDAVPFVLWFNFLSGFVYVLAVATLIIFATFGWHVFSSGAFEMRTVGAMILRSGV